MTDEQTDGQTRPEQLADALIAIAATDHYMIGLAEKVTLDELRDAEQILIEIQNSTPTNSRYWSELNAALDICENYIRKELSVPTPATLREDEVEDDGI